MRQEVFYPSVKLYAQWLHIPVLPGMPYTFGEWSQSKLPLVGLLRASSIILHLLNFLEKESDDWVLTRDFFGFEILQMPLRPP